MCQPVAQRGGSNATCALQIFWKFRIATHPLSRVVLHNRTVFQKSDFISLFGRLAHETGGISLSASISAATVIIVWPSPRASKPRRGPAALGIP